MGATKEGKAYWKAYRERPENKEKSKVYRAAHREERRAYNVMHREEIAIQKRVYYLAHQEKIKTYRKTYNATHREERAAFDRLHKYNLSKMAFDALLESQGGVCAICGKAMNGRRLSVDHCHVKNHIRGLLCLKYNAALGYVDENIPILEHMIDYLRRDNSGGENGLQVGGILGG